MSTPIYLDNAAAMPVHPLALEVFQQAVISCYANQEAIHGAADVIRRRLRQSAAELISCLGIAPDTATVFWSDSGTSVIAALLRHPRFARGEILLTGAEHPALTAAVRRLGVPFQWIPLDHGRIDLARLEPLLHEKISLVAVHQIQSETGIVQDLPAVGLLLRRKAPSAFFLADTIQAAGKLEIPWSAAKLDGLLISGAKIGSPGGAAAVCRKVGETDFLAPLAALRSTEHLVSRPLPAACLALTEALQQMQARRAENEQHVRTMNQAFRAVLNDDFPVRPVLLQPPENTSPYILHFLLPGYQAAVLVRMLSAENIFIAAGSACNAETPEPSPTLLAAGVSKADAFSGLRISFGPQNTVAEARTAAEALKQAVKNY